MTQFDFSAESLGLTRDDLNERTWRAVLAEFIATLLFVFIGCGAVVGIPRAWVLRFLPMALFGAVLAMVFNPPWVWALVFHLLAFVAVASCHRELAERRPAADHLTAFYLWLSLGGALGGLFNALVAPLLFSQVLEYPLALVAAALLRPSPGWRRGPEPLAALIALPAIVFSIVAFAWVFGLMPDISRASLVSGFWLLAALFLAFSNRSAPFALAVAAVLVSHVFLPRQQGTRVLFRARSFFGVHRVMVDAPATVHQLYHGTTLHGWQATDAMQRCEPTSYFHHIGPIGQVFAVLGERTRDVGVIGLGAGSLACYGRDDTSFTFYEIDPVVERVARDPALFTYLANARGRLRVVLGDGRVLLSQAAPQSLDLIVVDAFSSDAIPAHLLTREFIEMAAVRLRPHGIVAFHISNRHLNLGPVLSATAAAAGFEAVEQYHSPALADASASRWMVIGRRDGWGALLTADSRWRPAVAGPRIWTDDFSNILDVLTSSARAAAGSR